MLAAGLSYLLISVVFRFGAARTGGEVVEAVITCRGRSARVRLLRDTGNTLSDPATGLGVAVVDRHALGDLVSEKEAAALPRIPYCSVGQTDGTLPLLRCEGIILDGKNLGARSVALTERPPGDGGAYAGLWCEGCEKGEKDAATTQTAMG